MLLEDDCKSESLTHYIQFILEAIRCMNDQYTHVLAYFRYTEVKWDEKLTEIQTLRRNPCIV